MANRGFNLLRSQLSPATAWDKIYNWMIGTARIIIVLVELIVVIAFGVRVVVDTIGKNLDDDIEDVDSTLQAFSISEEEYRDIIAKTASYRDMWSASSAQSNRVAFVNSVIGNYTGEISVNMTDADLSIVGELEQSQVQEIEKALKAKLLGNAQPGQELFSSVELLDVDTSDQDQRGLANFSFLARFINNPNIPKRNLTQ